MGKIKQKPIILIQEGIDSGINQPPVTLSNVKNMLLNKE